MMIQKWPRLDRMESNLRSKDSKLEHKDKPNSKLDKKSDKLNFDKRNNNRSSSFKSRQWSSLTNDFLMDNDLMSDNLIKTDSSLLNPKKSSSFLKNKAKKNEMDENEGIHLDDEYFTDYLPSESELKEKISSVYNDFQPILNPKKLFKPLKERKNQTNDRLDDLKLIKSKNNNLNRNRTEVND